MGCCIALALIIGMVRLAWFRLVKGETPQRTGFAPPAHRPGPEASSTVVATRVSPPPASRSDPPGSDRPRTAPPGSDRPGSDRPRTALPGSDHPGSDHPGTAPPGSTPPRTAPPGSDPPRTARPGSEPRRAATGPVLALAALVGFGLYSALLILSARIGVVHAMEPGMSGQRRDLVLIAGGVAAVAVARVLRVHRAVPAERTRHRALALVGAGSAWSLLSVLDMHVTGMVATHHADVFADVVLHGPGTLALVLGTSLLLIDDRRPNPLSLTTTRGTS